MPIALSSTQLASPFNSLHVPRWERISGADLDLERSASALPECCQMSHRQTATARIRSRNQVREHPTCQHRLNFDHEVLFLHSRTILSIPVGSFWNLTWQSRLSLPTDMPERLIPGVSTFKSIQCSMERGLLDEEQPASSYRSVYLLSPSNVVLEHRLFGCGGAMHYPRATINAALKTGVFSMHAFNRAHPPTAPRYPVLGSSQS